VTATLRQLRQLLRDLPDSAAERLDRWILRLHRPEDVDGEAVCLHCQEAWPCDISMQAFGRIDAREPRP
jgi:hypothetical protein